MLLKLFPISIFRETPQVSFFWYRRKRIKWCWCCYPSQKCLLIKIIWIKEIS